MKHTPDPSSTGHRRLFLAVAWPALAISAVWILIVGARIVYHPIAISKEVYRPAVPLEGLYTAEELKLAESSIVSYLPPEKVISGLSRQELESLANNRRLIEQARKGTWELERAQRVVQARQRRPVGWVLIGLGVTVAGLWTWALRGMRSGFSSMLRQDVAG